MKLLYLLSAVACASVALAEYKLQICDNTCKRVHTFKTPNNIRPCICLASTQTGTIGGIGGGDIKLFQSIDCTGNFQKIGPNAGISNAQWVNSVSFGPSGSSRSPGTCPNWYN
ncbi:hypothetical protein KI688_011849 [Linnemannia hyalina]|uniref:Uncharacterized protein n=1 Tax=Linnemannia hyalina TaxID=64524 RepID=A0A9P7XVM3_9FUNG|nr:hypothetical protein BGX30_012752 [Mortierella sp. GBA39]KAG9068254.1 hypothetical protein KI688_011849 [Linnemannia hyalina]